VYLSSGQGVNEPTAAATAAKYHILLFCLVDCLKTLQYFKAAVIFGALAVEKDLVILVQVPHRRPVTESRSPKTTARRDFQPF
jgi:hypothetical protein